MTSEPKQTLNIRSPALKGLAGSSSDTLKQAVARRTLPKETFDTAWDRILAMKNSGPDDRRLREVKQAMIGGRIARDPGNANKRLTKAEVLRMWRILDGQ